MEGWEDVKVEGPCEEVEGPWVEEVDGPWECVGDEEPTLLPVLPCCGVWCLRGVARFCRSNVT